MLKNLNYQKGAKAKKAQEIEQRAESILKTIAIEPDITQIEIMEKLGVSRKQVQDAIKLLDNQNKIKRVGSISIYFFTFH